MNINSTQLVNFLKKENKILKQQIVELKQLIHINKEALRLSIRYKDGEINFQPLVELLYQENIKLLNKINQMKLEIQNGLCQALISDQIAFASTQHQQYITNQLKSKISKMKKQLESRDKRIYQLQKSKPQNNNENYIQAKIIEVFEPNTQNLKLKNQIQLLRQELNIKKQQINKIKDQKDEIMKLNLILTKQITQAKTIVAETTKSKAQQKSLISADLSKILNYQKKFVRQDESQQSSQDHEENFKDQDSESDSQEDYIPQPQKQMHTLPNINKFGQNKTKMSLIPKLQLTKAKQIQQLIVKKINNDEKKKSNNAGVVKQHLYKKLQNDFNQLRKKVGEVCMQKINEERQNGFLRKIIQELQARNQLLIQEKKMKQAQLSYYKRQQNGQQTLIDICRDVTMNEKLKQTLQGRRELQYKPVICYQC